MSASGRAAALTALLFALACDEAKPAPAPGRVVAVAAESSAASADEFCDRRYPAASAPKFALPEVEGPKALRARATAGRRWINLWASWCGPCVEELPLLRRWFSDFASRGLSASLVLLSIDATEEAVTKFAAQHGEARDTLRLAKGSALEPFLKSLGLDASATLPLHVFVDANDRVICTRMGAVSEGDLAAVKKLLSE